MCTVRTETDVTLRQREKDNLTNFKSGSCNKRHRPFGHRGLSPIPSSFRPTLLVRERGAGDGFDRGSPGPIGILDCRVWIEEEIDLQFDIPYRGCKGAMRNIAGIQNPKSKIQDGFT